MSIETYRKHFFDVLHEYKDDESGESLYEDANRLMFHDDSLPYLDALPMDFDSIVDVGCVCGYDARWFARKGKEVTAITSHSTPAQLAFASRHQFEMRHMDMQSLEFEDNSVDAILCKHCLEHAFFPLGASYRLRGGNVEAVVRAADTIPEGRGLYEIKELLPEPIQEIQRDGWHGGFPRGRFAQIAWPYTGAERTTIAAKERSMIERVSLRAVVKNRIERKLPGGRWLSGLL